MGEQIVIKGRIFEIKTFAVHDGPGIRTTVFLKGCPLRCIWCHNPEGISPQPEIAFIAKKCVGCGACLEACSHQVYSVAENGARIIDRGKCKLCLSCIAACYPRALLLYGEDVTVDQVLERITPDRHFYKTSNGGVTLSGGEPLLQPEFSAAVLQGCVEAGLHTAVDTCGYVKWEAFEAVLPFTKMFLYDFKHIDEELHRRHTGVSNALIIDNLKRLGACGIPVEIRMPIIPNINDQAKFIEKTGELLSKIPALTAVRLLKYHALAKSKYESLGKTEQMPPTAADQLETIDSCAAILKTYGLAVITPHSDQ
jgi:pyruvate formate lyase activating enzyme